MRATDSSLLPQRHKSQTASGEGSELLCASGIHIRANRWNGVSRNSAEINFYCYLNCTLVDKTDAMNLWIYDKPAHSPCHQTLHHITCNIIDCRKVTMKRRFRRHLLGCLRPRILRSESKCTQQIPEGSSTKVFPGLQTHMSIPLNFSWHKIPLGARNDHILHFPYIVSMKEVITIRELPHNENLLIYPWLYILNLSLCLALSHCLQPYALPRSL